MKKRLSERRFLATIQKDNNRRVYALINIKEPMFLSDAAEIIFDYFTKYKKANLSKMINLDTGFYNAIDVYKSSGERIDEITGSRSIEKVSNILYLFEN